ncbi:MAG: DUF493 family protein [Flavobacteriales bacterium]
MDYLKYEEQRQKLEKALDWPNLYMFKFIVPAKKKKVDQIRALFDEDADIRMKRSSHGNYVSVTIKKLMFRPESILNIYQKTSNIEGLIPL